MKRKSLTILTILIFGTAVLSVFSGCEKEILTTKTPNSSVSLTAEEVILKDNLAAASKLVAQIVIKPDVHRELSQLATVDYDLNRVSFSELVNGDLIVQKNLNLSFSSTRDAIFEVFASAKSSDSDQDLLQYLEENGCFLECVYPLEWYSADNQQFTVLAHPIDSEEGEAPGYRFIDNALDEVMVDEDYADIYPILLVLPKSSMFSYAEYDEIEYDEGELLDNESKAMSSTKVYEVKLGKYWCSSYFGTATWISSFKMHILRGQGSWDPVKQEVIGSWPTNIVVNYPRKYAKAAKNGWNSYKNGGWYDVNAVWDSNWSEEKTQQAIAVYRYKKRRDNKFSATVGVKVKALNATVTTSTEKSYSGDPRGCNDWDREWFYKSNTNGSEKKDGWTVRKTSSDHKMTFPTRTL